MVNHIAILVLSLLAGMALGLFFFGGLWWTLKRITVVRNPGLLVSLSLLLRSVLTMAGLYLVFDTQLERLLAAVVGMLIVRFWLNRRITAQISVRRSGQTKEGMVT